MSDFDGMTLQELCEWANGLGICEFEVTEHLGSESVMAKCGKKVFLELSIGRYNESVPELGGMAHGKLYWQDWRDGYGGGCDGDVSLDAFGRMVASCAERLGLAKGQLCLF